jgi:hypothetical protein
MVRNLDNGLIHFAAVAFAMGFGASLVPVVAGRMPGGREAGD